MRRRTKKIIIISLISLLVIFLLSIGLYNYGLGRVNKVSEKVTFTIEIGTSTKDIIHNLKEAGIIKSKLASMIYIKLNKDIMIKAGNYELDRSYNSKKIFKILSDGKSIEDTVVVAFIEGKTFTNYMGVIRDKFGFSDSDILAVISDQEYLKELVNKYKFLTDDILNKKLYYALEGYLFPSTYEFYKDASIKDIIEKMLDKTAKVLDNYSALLKESSYNVHEILTIASIIENETMVADQRDEVSQVIYTRLDKNMSLGMDVTTYYGVQKSLSEELTKSDLNDKNAYNTRRTDFIGLPVGPICNPSESSIKAALSPNKETKYVYFYAEMATGKLHFAETITEFHKLIDLYS